MRAWSYVYAGRRFTRILEKNEVAEAAKPGFVPTDDAPIDAQGRQVFVNPRTGQYIVRAEDVRTPGVWESFDERGGRLGFARNDLAEVYPDPPLNPDFPPNAVAMTPAQKKYQKERRGWEKLRAALLAGGATADQIPPPPEDPDETPEAKAKKKQEADAKAAAEREAERQYRKLARDQGMNADSATTRDFLSRQHMKVDDFIKDFRKRDIRRVISTDTRESTIADLLKRNDDVAKTAKKLLVDGRFAAGAR